MAGTTTNYGWTYPTSTDLVKDGATAIQTAIQGADTSLFSITGGKNVGLVFLNTTTFSAVSTVSIDNVFSSTYNNYRVVIQTLGSIGANFSMRYRTGGVDESGATYNYEQLSGTNAAASAAITNSQTSQNIGAVRTSRQTYELNVYDPALATSYTTSTNIVNDFQSASTLQLQAHWFANAKAVDGFTLIPASGTITGTVRIYGYRNS